MTENANQYLYLDDFAFDPLSISKSTQQSKTQEEKPSMEDKRAKNILRKKTYDKSYFLIYSVLDQGWILIHSEILEF